MESVVSYSSTGVVQSPTPPSLIRRSSSSRTAASQIKSPSAQSNTLVNSSSTTTAPKFLGSLGPKPPNSTSTEMALKTVAIHAKFFEDNDVQYKLRLLATADDSKFDELMEQGFPMSSMQHDQTPFSSSTNVDFKKPEFDETDEIVGHTLRNESSSSSTSSWRHPLVPPPMSRLSDASSGRTSYEQFSGPRMGEREMTLKFTLTPASMRADEDKIYGWQQDHIDSGTVRSLKSIGNGDDDLDPPPLTPGGAPTIASQVSNEGPPVAPYYRSSTRNEASFIPAGGLGGDVSSKKKVQRMFGRLRKPRTQTNAYMITSADVARKTSTESY
jgi:hypothetical protein